MKRLTFILTSVLCILCCSCEKDNNVDVRDNVIGHYSYTQVGSVTATIGSQTVTESLDSEGTFTIDKNTSTTTGLYFYGSDLLKEGWMSGNTLQIADAKTTFVESGVTFTYTVKYSPCTVVYKTFTTTATISGSVSYNGQSYPLNGKVSLTAQSR